MQMLLLLIKEKHMKEEIVFGGLFILHLEQLANMKAAMLKDSVKFVSDGIEKATLNLIKILEIAEDYKSDDHSPALLTINNLAEKTNELLKNVSLVSDITGVTYYLPYYEEYSDESPFSGRLEDLCEGPFTKSVRALYATLETMEGNSKDWHSSTC